LLFCSTPSKLKEVAAYSQFLGYRVTVKYRVGEMLLSASGIFSADSGRSVFLEQHVEQRGARKYFRWEIPYPYIHRIETEAEPEQNAKPPGQQDHPAQRAAAAKAGQSAGTGPSSLPFSQRPKTV
jgi:hypothetical protein